MSAGRRGGTPEQAREYRAKGHRDAKRFAESIGLGGDYKNDPQAKKDVIDPSGDAHSVKSGIKKWQIFLYRRSRFEQDDGFQALNGVGSLLIHCIDAFPPRYEDYQHDKKAPKERLRTPMRELKDRFQRKALLRAFLMKSIFNGGEVNYLTIFHKEKFHVYRSEDIVRVMGDAFSVKNSQGNPPEQKVLFKYKDRNVGELEMRNDSRAHYGEVRFNMLKIPCMEMLEEFEDSIFKNRLKFSNEVIAYGKATRTFGKWTRQ